MGIRCEKVLFVRVAFLLSASPTMAILLLDDGVTYNIDYATQTQASINLSATPL
ncbi:MAG TPA: hypothetical protein VJJ98_07545 [Sedimentisphaerales bacterium]|nr:hypothetical protein [Sedimentisphaerales bacterium]